MLNESKPFASLGPTLLARKGGARPAMRPQFSPLIVSTAAPDSIESDLDDLGWNDMGAEELQPASRFAAPHEQPLELSAFDSADEEEEDDLVNEAAYGSLLSSAPHDASGDADTADEEAAVQSEALPAPEPEVRRQQRTLAAALTQEAKPSRRKAAAGGRRAAFTLRLDAERHLKLRLASTIRGLSAQQLVTQALDEFLANIPEIDSLAAQVKRA